MKIIWNGMKKINNFFDSGLAVLNEGLETKFNGSTWQKIADEKEMIWNGNICEETPIA